MLTINPENVAAPVGRYSHAISHGGHGTWLHLSGQVGILPNGDAAAGLHEQTHAIWRNIRNLLTAADMDLSHLVNINTYVVDRAWIKPSAEIRASYLGEHRPASTIVVVHGLADPAWLIEIEALAFNESR